jgi:hypothetical protein
LGIFLIGEIRKNFEEVCRDGWAVEETVYFVLACEEDVGGVCFAAFYGSSFKLPENPHELKDVWGVGSMKGLSRKKEGTVPVIP